MIELDRAFFADPHRHYRRWHERGSVHRVRFPDGKIGWVVTGYAEARAALADPRLRKAGANARWAGIAATASTHMLDADPPDHTRLRKLVNQAFTARAVEALRPRVEQITDALLDQLTGDRFDLLEEFAVPLPVTVIGELLGVAPGDRGARAGAAPQGVPRRPRPARAREPRRRPPLEPGASPRRARPPQRARARRHGLRAARRRLRDRNPGQLDALRADLTRVPAAVEELLRYDGRVGFATLRYAADRLDLARDPAGHIAFGHGIHHCVGAPLARLEAQVALTRLLRRFPRLSLAADDVAWREGIRIRGLPSLPVRPNE